MGIDPREVAQCHRQDPAHWIIRSCFCTWKEKGVFHLIVPPCLNKIALVAVSGCDNRRLSVCHATIVPRSIVNITLPHKLHHQDLCSYPPSCKINFIYHPSYFNAQLISKTLMCLNVPYRLSQPDTIVTRTSKSRKTSLLFSVLSNTLSLLKNLLKPLYNASHYLSERTLIYVPVPYAFYRSPCYLGGTHPKVLTYSDYNPVLDDLNRRTLFSSERLLDIRRHAPALDDIHLRQLFLL